MPQTQMFQYSSAALNNLFTFLLLFALPGAVPAQENTAADPEAAEMYQAALEDLDGLRLDLNHASEEDLAHLPWLSHETAHLITSYRKKHGPFETLNALRSIIPPDTFDAITPYLTTRTEPRFFAQTRTRLSRPSGLKSTWPNLRLYQRTEFRLGAHTESLILTERDPKESGIADFVSGYLLLSALPGLHRLLLGDFRPGMGQGLLFSRQDRSATGLAWARPSSNSRIGSRSSTEEGALRGIYLESLPGFLTWSAFAGRATWDAATDSTENAAIRRGGEHVSPLQKSRKHALTERIVSLRLTSRLPFGKVGLSLCHLAFSAPVLTSGPPRQQQTPVGLNWNLSVRNVALFGELAPGPETAWLSGTTLRFNTLRLTVLARRYDPSYYAPHAAAFSAYSGWPHNEWGLFAGAAWAPRKGTRIQLDLDRHGRLLPETDAPLPSRGERFTFSMTQRLSRHQNLDLTLGTQQETVTTSSRTGPRLRKRYRVAYSLHPPEFRIRAWTEITRGATPARRGIGAATAADLRLGRSSGPRLDLWFTRFHTTAYEARIYMFEPDVWGGSRLQVLSGSGQAFGTRLSWSGAVFSFSGRYSFKRTPEGVSSSWSFQVDLGSLE